MSIATAALLAIAPASASATSRSRSDAAHASARASACGHVTAHLSRRQRRDVERCRARAHVLGTRAGKLAKPRPGRSLKSRRRHDTPQPPPSTEASSAVALAATIATVLATPCENTELTPEADNLPLIRAAVLCLINHKRAENGENPLKLSAQLEAAAEGHCQELIADDYFAHISPSGETPVDRIRETGYIPNSNVGYVIGENLAWGTYELSTPQAIVSAWIASPGHLANILEAKYVETGIGVTPAVPSSLAPGASGATYAQEFGVIIE